MSKRFQELVVADFNRGIYRRDFLKGLGATAAGLCALGQWNPLAIASQMNEQPKMGGKLRAAITPGILSLDGRNVSGVQSFQLGYNFYNKLIRWVFDNNKLKIVGDLAESWEFEDETTLVFHLKDNVKFHNGEILTAEDVAHTFNTTLDPKNRHSLIVMMQGLKEVEARDPLTAVIRTGNRPFGPILGSLASYHGIVSKKADMEQDMRRNPVGTGPFKFVEWVDGDHITMVRHEQYFKKGLPYLDEIRWDIVPDASVKVSGLETGQFQWIDRIPPMDVARFERDKRIKVVKTPPGGFQWYVCFNVKQEPFNNPKVRQALVWAFPAQDIIEVALFNTAKRTDGQGLNGALYGWDISVPDPYQTGPDFDKAKKLLNEAGVGKFSAVSWVERGETQELRALEVTADAYSKVGVDLEIRVIEEARLFDEVARKDNFGIHTQAISGFVDPDQILYISFHTGLFFNWSNWSDPRTDELLETGRFSTDRNVRMNAYNALYREVLFPQVPQYFYAWQEVPYGMRANVTGFPPIPNLEAYMEQVGFI